MARGKRKEVLSLTEQILAKEEEIKVLDNKMKVEKDALKALKQAQMIEEVEVLHNYISTSNLTPEKAIEILQKHSK